MNAPGLPPVAPAAAAGAHGTPPGVPAIGIRALSHAYADGPTALSDVDLRIEAGEAVAIVGANGAGKSTLLQHLNGLLLADSGSVQVEGITVGRGTLAEVRRRVGFVFQDPDDQLFMPTVQDDVAFGLLNQGTSVQDVPSRVCAALDAVGAAHLAARPPYRLSGGEKRAVALAGVLAMAPSILVLDEPTAALDAAARRRLIGWLCGFAQTRVIATHDLDLVLDLCPRVVVLHRGRVAADGAAADILADGSLLAACGLELPLRCQRQRP
jgi:cobalt/nickel transport system ATP-binding protein